MRAVRYAGAGGEARIGRLEDDRIVDAGPADARGFDASAEAWERVAGASGASVALEGARLLHPVVPRKLIGIGLNYRDHAAESNLDIPEVPVLFAKFASAMVGDGEPIVIPREETRPDYEGEVAVVIGRRTYRADTATARAAIGGISAMNDVSGRRAQLETPLRQFTLGKSFDTFAPMGPCVAALEPGADLAAIAIRTTVSGEVLQESSTANLIFSLVELIEYCSKGMTLEPGDVIATGTPGGVGDSRTPPRYLRDGDVVEIWVEGVGTLRNPVSFES
jgi:2-keto-4-pentenoate hydratase/2-oxohepta-3-ene-1,7-dioic acid hydratase in catechol pathway